MKLVTIIYLRKVKIMTNNSSRQGDDPTEVEITPAMISAGVDALSCLSVGSDPSELAEEVVEAVFVAMIRVSKSQ